MIHLGDRETRSAIAQRLARLTAGDAALWGEMNAHQAVCHLCDAFRLPLGRKPASEASGFLQRTLIKWIALHAPMAWPKGVSTRPEMKQGVGGTPPREFLRDRGELAALIEEFAALREISVAHPIFGTMTREEWMRWGYLHTDHHLRQFGA
jgi:hypothetical protein